MISKRHLLKSLSWRLIASVDTFTLSYIISSDVKYGASITLIEIISKTMLTGILDPLLGGVLLGALLSSPNTSEDSFDHKANIKVIGNKILLNGKPII